MAIQQRRTESSIFMALKVLQFVHHLRRRIKPRSDLPSILRADICLDLKPKDLRSFAKSLPRARLQKKKGHSNHASDRVCKSRNKQTGPRPRLKLQATGQDNAAIQNISGEEVQHLLNSVDDKLSPPGSALSAVAKSDEVFLRQKPMEFGSCSLNELTQNLVLVHGAIRLICACRSQFGDKWLIAEGLHEGVNFDETFLANYEHLLFRLQTEIINALHRKVLEALLLGGRDKQQHRLLSWFTEFAEKPRPLSTFPWTIKPSLAVLWGVCWMFYDRNDLQRAQRGNPRIPVDAVLQHAELPTRWNTPGSRDYLNFGLELVGTPSQPEAQQRLGGSRNRGLDVDLRLRNAEPWFPNAMISNAPQAVSRADSVQQGSEPCLGTYSSSLAADLHAFNSDPNILVPNYSGIATNLIVFPQQLDDGTFDTSWPPHSQSTLPQRPARHLTSCPAPRILVTGSAVSESYTTAPQPDFASFDPTLYRTPSQEPQAPPLNIDTSNIDDFSSLINNTYNMGNCQPPEISPILALQGPRHERTSSINSNSNFPTPVSMGGNRSPLLSPVGDRRHSTASSMGPMRQQSEDRSSISQDDDRESPRRNHAYKRSEEPPRNMDSKMVCKHNECTGLTFDRKCEWSKHMDKHDRPYKCNVKGCEKLQGFTYSGGLLRHEREVHKMHGGTKKSLFCPFTDCKRSSGSGFTRKENLAEHIRRVHRRTSMSADLGHLIIQRSDSIDENSIADMRLPSESLFARIPEMPAEEEAHNPMKRKRMSEAGPTEDGVESDLRSEVKRLRRENEEKDARLRQLEAAVMALQQGRR